MEPEFQDDCPKMSQVPLHTVYLPISSPPLGLRTETLHPLNQYASVPGPIEDGDMPGFRHLRPETPEIVMRFLDVVRGSHRHHFVPAGIKILSQPANVASLSGRVPTLVSDDHRNSPQINLVFQFAQLRLRLLQPSGILLRGEGFRQIHV